MSLRLTVCLVLSLSKTLYPLFCNGLIQEDRKTHPDMTKNVDWNVKHKELLASVVSL